MTCCLLACLYCGAYYAGSGHERQREAVLSIAGSEKAHSTKVSLLTPVLTTNKAGPPGRAD